MFKCKTVRASTVVPDIAAGTYTEVEFYDLLNTFISKGASRSTTSPITVDIASGGDHLGGYVRSCSSIGLSSATSAVSGTTYYSATFGGEYSNNGSTWTTQSQTLTAFNWILNGTIHRTSTGSGPTGTTFTVSDIKFI